MKFGAILYWTNHWDFYDPKNKMVKLRCKVGIVGDSTVGKSSLIKMFKERTFPNQYLMTIGADLYTKTIDVPVITNDQHESLHESNKENQVELYLFDISGSSIYESGYNEYVCNFLIASSYNSERSRESMPSSLFMM